MNFRSVWGRLLWKEFMEGRFVLLAVFLASLVIKAAWSVEGLAYADACGHWAANGALAVPVIGIHMAIAFWAIGRGGSRRSGSEFSWTHLPTSPAVEWLASMIVPSIVIAGLGAWFGWCATPPTVKQTIFVPVPVAGALDLASTFVVCYLISMVISNWAAYLFGVFRLVGGTLILVWNLTLMLQPDAVWGVARTFVGAIIGAFLYAVLLRKRPLAFRQASALVVVVLITFVPLIPEIPFGEVLKTNPARYADEPLCNYVCYARDWSAMVAPVRPYMNGKAYLELRDYRSGITRKRLFSACCVFDVEPGGRAYIASSKPGRTGVTIREWDAVKDKVRTIGVIPVKAKYFTAGPICSVSPDGTHMALLIKSLLCSEMLDLWLIDLRKNEIRLALPDMEERDPDCSSESWRFAWPKGKVAVWNELRGATAVDIQTLKSERIAFEDGGSKL